MVYLFYLFILFIYLAVCLTLVLLTVFSFQPVLHDWCNKGRGMCYPIWDDAYKRTLAVYRKE